LAAAAPGGVGRRAHKPSVFEAPHDRRHLAGVALLDLDFGEAVADRPVDRSVRRRDVERRAVGARRESLEIGADLVGEVAARGDPIRAHDHQIDASALHEMAAGVVDDDGVRHAVLGEFERGQRRALIARPRLVDEDVHRRAAVVGHVDRRRRGAPIDRRQPAGVAMGQDVDRAPALAVDRFDQGQAGLADAPVAGDVLVAQGARARPRAPTRPRRVSPRRAARRRR
jgi:predicted nucleic acid-binding protein